MSEVAGLLYLERSSTTGLVARAEAHGLVQRHREGGLTRVALTDDGRAIAEKLAGLVSARLDARGRLLSPQEREQLTQLAGRLLASSSEQGAAPEPASGAPGGPASDPAAAQSAAVRERS
jgi:DNA-binding MarR family transcriptional regulator